jgi:transcriptional regulator
MYRPAHFAEDRPDVVFEMIGRGALGHVVVSTTDGFDTTPVPLIVKELGEVRSLRGHVARANPIWRAAPRAALVIVPVVDAYVSPSWYPSKAEHGKVVPTWNYEVVNVHGRLVAHDDTAWVERLVRDLTDVHEAAFSDPWSVDDAPDDFVHKQLRAIVGIEIVVDRVEAKRKLSQNRSDEDRDGVVVGLRSRGSAGAAAVAEAMVPPLT